ncbi:hypothetical protein G6F46_003920 [Rhizopus delemar]|uniref:Uncharacterized protein n=2 Tax=Rhizopus TaxID=4842 RepID=A0A9P6ZA73_9FUNG|nr:hypothetical protein G6F55_003288 [Rhizopus delemar]KAG1547813.1 hypothetical protein G6F51_004044 [Rhizopus arrhizus]KAG1501042.1 hypothetical protein G6F54_003308 [Rhizopus delemar]KAG1514716.1 hypothetical protein G6F53_003469 [Rhizopus delemar]KAG1521684.1 hypothetical protein G6F52_006521 [Rhizopus delemar]
MTMISTFYHTFSKDENYKNNPNDKVDETEAGSILVSMANQNNQRSRPIHSTMSIHNLLDLNESKKEYKASLMDSRKGQYTSSSNYHSSLSENQSDGHSVPSTPPSYHSHLHKTHDPKYSLGGIVTLDARIQPSGEQPCFGHHPSLLFQSNHTMQPPPYQKEFIIQKKQEKPIKQYPKYRRNAIHTYISYMTFADLMRRKTKQQEQEQQAPIGNNTSFPFHQQSLTNSIIDQPLTAFLHQPSSSYNNSCHLKNIK